MPKLTKLIYYLKLLLFCLMCLSEATGQVNYPKEVEHWALLKMYKNIAESPIEFNCEITLNISWKYPEIPTFKHPSEKCKAWCAGERELPSPCDHPYFDYCLPRSGGTMGHNSYSVSFEKFDFKNNKIKIKSFFQTLLAGSCNRSEEIYYSIVSKVNFLDIKNERLFMSAPDGASLEFVRYNPQTPPVREKFEH